MKLSALLLTIALILASNAIYAQEIQETTKETAQFTNGNHNLSIHNIYGSITIEGYEGAEAIIEIDKYIKAKAKKGLDQAIDEIKVNITQHDGRMLIYVEDGNNYFDLKKMTYQSRNMPIRKTRYKYRYDFTVKVPYDTEVAAHAINDGELVIKDIASESIIVNNLNGSIALNNVSGAIDANALNKDIDVTYSKNPTKASYFNALNGDVNVKVIKGFKGDIFFKSMNGDFYTSIDENLVKSMTTTEKDEWSANSGKNKKVGKVLTKLKIKLNSNQKYKIREGGPEMHFSLLNGDVNLYEIDRIN